MAAAMQSFSQVIFLQKYKDENLSNGAEIISLILMNGCMPFMKHMFIGPSGVRAPAERT